MDKNEAIRRFGEHYWWIGNLVTPIMAIDCAQQTILQNGIHHWDRKLSNDEFIARMNILGKSPEYCDCNLCTTISRNEALDFAVICVNKIGEVYPGKKVFEQAITILESMKEAQDERA